MSYGTAAAAGDDLVVIDWRSGEAALRRADGTWWKLPSAPFNGSLQMATAGNRAVTGGIACTNSGCTKGELAFAMLNEEHTAWTRLEAPKVPLSPSDTEMTTAPGPTKFAEFLIGKGTYLVDPDGEVSEWTPQPTPSVGVSAGDQGCTVGDSYLSVKYITKAEAAATPASEITRDVYVQPVGGADEPVSVGPVPPGPMPQMLLCTTNHLTVSDNATQAILDVASRTWITGPSNLMEMSDSFISPISGRLASAPDGSTAFLQATGNRIIKRARGGLWDDTGVTGHVYSTNTAVLVIGEDRSVTTVWSP
ncbi:MAG: hypothetical protein WBF71_01490 [Microthrixaceae bacterium]